MAKKVQEDWEKKQKTKVVKVETSQTQEAVKEIILSGQYEGFSIGKNGKLPVTLNFETSNEGEILGNYKYKAGNKIYCFGL